MPIPAARVEGSVLRRPELIAVTSSCTVWSVGFFSKMLTDLYIDVPTLWQAAWLLAKGTEALGDIDAAVVALRGAHAQHPEVETIAKDFSLLLLKRDEVGEARDVNRAIAASQPNAQNLCNLAVTELLTGDLDAADVALTESQALDPNDPVAKTIRSRIAKYRAGAPLPKTIRELERG